MSADLHVAFIITRGDAVGGATVHVRDMARYLLDHGMRATVLVGGHGEVTDAFSAAGVRYISLASLQRSIHPSRDLQALFEIRSALRGIQPDLVSAHTAKAGWLGRLAARLVGIPAIYTPHGWAITDRISKNSGRIYRLAEVLAAPLARSIVNVCEAERQLAIDKKVTGWERLAVIHNGVRDLGSGWLAQPGVEPPRIIMVARFEAPKDHHTLLAALAELKAFPWNLELVGSGPAESEVRAQAAALGITARVFYSPSTSVVAERLRESQIFVLASRSEGFPRSILEAMRAGLPVVASDVGGACEAVTDGSTGYLVPRGDSRRLAERIAALLVDPNLRCRMGRAGRRSYESKFTFERMAEETLGLYRKVLNRAPATVAVGKE